MGAKAVGQNCYPRSPNPSLTQAILSAWGGRIRDASIVKGRADMLGRLHSHLSNITGTEVLEVVDSYRDHEMGNTPYSAGTPLECVLRSWERFDAQMLQKKSMNFFLLPGLASISPGGWRVPAP